MSEQASGAPQSAWGELLPWLYWLDETLKAAMEAVRTAYGEDAVSDPYRGLYITHSEFDDLLARGPEAPAPALGAAGPAPDASTLGGIGARFALDTFELSALVIALAPELDARYERLYAYLQDDVTRRRPCVEMILNLLCRSAEEKLAKRVAFASDGRLVRHGLVQVTADTSATSTFLSRAVRVEESFVRRLLRHEAEPVELRGVARLSYPDQEFDEPLGDERTWRALGELVRRSDTGGHALRVYLSGENEGVKPRLAEAAATLREAPLLTIALDVLATRSGDFEETLRKASREAGLRGATLLMTGLGALAAEDRRPMLRAVLRILEDRNNAKDLTVLTGVPKWVSIEATAGRPGAPVFSLDCPLPDAKSREDYWEKRLRRRGVRFDAPAIEALAARFRFSEARIDDVLDYAERQAEVRSAGGDGDPRPRLEELYATARDGSSHNLSSLASKVTPRYGWTDIVLPPDAEAQLREIRNQAQYRHRIYGEWGFDEKLSLGKGLNVLFSGPPGVGKTMAAEVLAGSLELDLYRVDLSQTVSKYIGETERNLSKVFAEARTSNAILFFDEADALFGKRSEVRDAHDRYANIEISYLLQKMEEYEGISILATNLKQNLDHAFTRRLSFTVDFPFPDETSRRRIWDHIWPEKTPRSRELDLDFVARRFQLSGGGIKNVAVSAAFLAAAEPDGEVRTEHVLRAARREFQKMGKDLAAVEFGDYAASVLPELEERLPN